MAKIYGLKGSVALVAVTLGLVAVTLGMALTDHTEAAEISISCGAVGMELELCTEGANAWAEAIGNSVEINSAPNAATEQFAVSKYSENAEIVADLVKYLTSSDEQKRRTIEDSYNPRISSLYQGAEVLEAPPFFGELYDTFTNAVARPSKVTGEKYNQVSSEFFNAAHDVLSGKSPAADRLAALESELDRLSRGGRW